MKYCFCEIGHKLRDVKYKIKYAFQRAFRGYDDTARYSLYSYIAEIAAPVLREMEKKSPSYPMGYTPEQWSVELGKMALAMELLADDMWWVGTTREEQDRSLEVIDEGLKLFFNNFRDVWT